MPKQKTHKGLAKRVKISKNGKVKRKRAFGGHLMSHKSGNQRRAIAKSTGMSPAMTKKACIALGA